MIQRIQMRSSWHVGICVALFVLGLLLRVYALPTAGYEFDIKVVTGWARSAATFGIAESYLQQLDGNGIPNYPPFSIWLFAAVGHLYQFIEWMGFTISPELSRALIKLPANVADILTSVCLYFVVKQWKGKQWGGYAAALYWLHPVAIYNSAYWGQTDAVYAALSVLATLLLLRKRFFPAGAVVALALMTKPHPLVFTPIWFVMLLPYWRRWIHFLSGFVMAAFIVTLPFILNGNVISVIDTFSRAASNYFTVTFNAYNLWWLLLADSANGRQDSEILFNFLSFRKTGLLMFSVVYAYTFFKLGTWILDTTKEQRRSFAVFLAATTVFCGFFVLNTQMHERYMFAFITFGVPLVFMHRHFAYIYALGSFAHLMNHFGALPFSFIDKALFRELQAWDLFVAACNVATLALLLRMVWLWGSPLKDIWTWCKGQWRTFQKLMRPRTS